MPLGTLLAVRRSAVVHVQGAHRRRPSSDHLDPTTCSTSPNDRSRGRGVRRPGRHRRARGRPSGRAGSLSSLAARRLGAARRPVVSAAAAAPRERGRTGQHDDARARAQAAQLRRPHRAVSRPDRRIAPGFSPVAALFVTVSTPFTSTCATPSASAVSRALPPGRSATSVAGVGADGLGIEHHDVGLIALGQPTASTEPEQARRLVGDHLHRDLDRHELPAAEHVTEEPRGVRRAAHAVEVRAGIAAADHRPRVLPRLLAERPRRVVTIGRNRPEDRAEIVLDDDVEERVERWRAPLGHEVAHGAALEPVVRGGVGVAEHVVPPVGEATEHAGLVAVGARVHPRARLRVLQPGDALRDGQAS